MPRRRSPLRLCTGPSLTRPDLVGRADPEDQVDLGPVVRDPVDLADRAVRGLGPGDPVDRAVRHPVDLAGIRRRLDLALRDPVDPAGIRLRVVLADRHPADRVVPVDLVLRGPVDLAGIRRRVDLVDLVLRGPVDLAGIRRRVVLAGLDLAVRVDRAGRVNLGGQGMDPADPVVLPDRHRRRTHLGAISSGVARRWAAPGMCRTASAPPITVRRRRLHNTDGVGMADRHPERRRLSGMDRRPRVAGTVHRLPVVGMSDGTGRRATKALPSVISDHSITTGTARFQCSTRCSVDGASGSSVSGFRCTDAT
jgi:hypothetical protein